MSNISVISFLQGVDIGGKVYNGYSVITNTKNEDVVMEDSIYIKTDGIHRITENGLKSAGAVGIFNVNLEARTESDGTNYLPIVGQLSYSSIVTQNSINPDFESTYNSNIIKYVKSLSDSNLKKIYFTALARERYGIYRPRIKI